MKSNLNNIDEIFREGLNNFAQEPESGLWKKIAGRLLWREILRFNFTNLPAAWTGVVAAGIVVTSLLVYNLLPTQNPQAVLSVAESVQALAPVMPPSTAAEFSQNVEKDLYQNQINKNTPEKVLAENNTAGLTISETNVQRLSQNQPPESVGQKGDNTTNSSSPDMDTPEISESESGFVSLSSEDGIVDREIPENQGMLDQTAENSLLVDQTIDNGTSGNLPVEPLLVSSAMAVAPLPEETFKIASPETIAEPTSGLTEIPLNDNSAITQVKSLNSDDIKIVDDQKYEPQNPEIANTHSEQYLAIGNSMEKSNQSSGKTQNMNSVSHSIGSLFKGKYKPPKRDFDEGTMELYRGKTTYFSVSAYGAYEGTDYSRMVSSSREKTWSGGASVSYHKSRLVFQGGLEYSYMNDVGDYMVDMSTYDSVGFYYGVGEFVVDPDNPDSVIFVIQKVTVYDSVQHQSNYQTQCSFTYLQIPLMVGYKALQAGRFSAYIKAGPSISIMLNKKVPEFVYTNPEATIHSINNYSLPRLTASVQAVVSLSLQYQLFKNVGILVEPTYRYYIQGVYDVDGKNIEKPYAVGIKGGIYYNFW